MKKIILSLMLLLAVSQVWAWTPSLRYSGWVGDFRVDKAWENITEPKANEGSKKSWNDRYQHVKMIDMPNCIAWSCMIWDEHVSNADDYQLNKCRLYLYNKATKESMDIVTIQFNTNDDNDTKFDYMTDHNGNDTRIAGRRFFDKDDGSQHMFLTTKISSRTRDFILNAGKNNLQIGFWAHWDDSHWNDFDRKSDVALHWEEDFTFLTLDKPTLSNVQWCNKEGKTSIQYNANNSEGVVTVDLMNPQGKSCASKTGTGEGWLTSNTITKEVMDGATMGVRPTARKTYTMQGTWYSPYPMTNYSNSLTTVGDTYYPARLQQVQGLVAVEEDDAKIRLKWDVKNRESGKDYDRSDWVVERAKQSDFSGDVIKQTVGYSSTSPSYAFVDEMTERECGEVTYFYRVYRANAAESYNNGNKDNYTQCKINTNYPRVSNLQGTSDGNKVQLTWEISDGLWNNQMQVELVVNYEQPRIFRKEENSTSIVLPVCVPTTFTLRVMEGSVERSRTQLENFILPSTVPSHIQQASFSKGYQKDYVPIWWVIDQDAANFSHYVVKRKEYGASDETYQSLTTIQNTPGVYQYSYEDHTAVAGVYYEYCIDGYATCDADVHVAAAKKDIGFTQPYGVVSGQIAFGGNQAVAGVSVMAVGDGKRRNRSVYFYDNKGTIAIPLADQITAEQGCIEMWMRQDTDLTTYEMARFENVSLSVADSVLPNHQFNHVAWSWKDGQVTTWVNGMPVAEEAMVNTAADRDSIYIAGSGYMGWVDEIRIWNHYRDSVQVNANFDRYLNGSEFGLVGYYRCDDDLPNRVYDISKVSTRYNEHHATTLYTHIDENNIPTENQLALKTVTDENGNYLLNAVPYTAEGCLYKIIPSMGVHEFAPTNKPLFFDANTSTHNSVDFTDVSSFEVSGQVLFENTNYPVAGCQFAVDGGLCVSNGKAVESDEEGRFTISVPIGKHYITVRKDGHTFVSEGRFPADPADVGTQYDFNHPETINFTDNTTVLLTGRVAGGEEEERKAHGFGLGKNNIGQAEAVLTPKVSRYDLNLSTSAERIFAVPDSVQCHSRTWAKAQQGGDARYITIQTDAETGEFTAALPPIDFEVTSIRVPSSPEIQISTGKYGDIALATKNIADIQTDSIRIDSLQSVRVFNYLEKLDIIYRVQPIMRVTDVAHENRDQAMGDAELTLTEKTGVSHNLTAYTVDETGEVHYTYGYPIFQQGHQYTWRLYAYEQYINRDGDQPDTTDVPVRQAPVTIMNELGEGVPTDPNDTTVKVLGVSSRLNDNGVLLYTFAGGEPNIAEPFTKSVTITYKDSAETADYTWRNDPFLAVVLGAKTSGTNFVTKGVDKPLFVLRDPPGKGSFAKWSKGTTTTQTTSTSSTELFSSTVNLIHVANMEVQSMLGGGLLGVGIINNQFNNNNEVGPKTTYEYGSLSNNSTTYSLTSTQDIITSDLLSYDGKEGDVFIGASMNMLFGNARQLTFVRDPEAGSGWTLGVEDAISCKEQFQTTFAYTQTHIETSLIPNFIKLRNALLTYLPESEDTITVNPTNQTLYITHVREGEPGYGTDYRVVYPAYADLEDTIVTQDMVDLYNAQVRQWERTLADNEHMRVIAMQSEARFDSVAWNKAAQQAAKEKKEVWEVYKGGYLMDNFSYDGGSDIVRTITETGASTSGSGHTNSVKAMLHTKFGAQVFGIGLETTTEIGGGYSDVSQHSTTTTDNRTISFKLTGNAYEALTVDVYHAPDGFGPIFRTRGGQTYCPYEGETLSKYYEPGKHVLNTATVKMEEPQLLVDQASFTNIPIGKQANYRISLANIADLPSYTSWLYLRVLENTNPDGAVLLLDGMPLNGDGRRFRAQVGQTYAKTLVLKQGREDILDYENIAVVLSSDCAPYSEADTIYLSAHFVPSCSDVVLNIPSRIINSGTKDTALQIMVQQYDTTYRSMQSIRLQYRKEGETDWHLIREYVKNPLAELGPNQAYLPVPMITYSMPFGNFADGQYTLRAEAVCQFGSEEKTVSTEEVTIIKDMSRPEALGLPRPINGIYTVDNEVFVTLSEPIQTGMLSEANVEVTAIMNAHPITHSVGLQFHSDGEQTDAYTEAEYDLSRKDWTWEGWVNMNFTASNSNIFFNVGNSGMLVLATENRCLQARLNGTLITTTTPLPDDTWMYLMVSYEVEDDTTANLSAYVAYDDQDRVLLDHVPAPVLSVVGNVSLGYSADCKMHDVLLMSMQRTWLESKQQMYKSKELLMDNVLSYWPMHEGSGKVAQDVSRSRHLVLPANAWWLNTDNYALHVDKEQPVSINISECGATAAENYAFEFWFRRSEPGTLFRLKDNGWAFGLEESHLNITADTIHYRLPIYGNYLDNQWHHFAFDYQHGSGTAILLDGAAIETLYRQSMPDFVSSQVVFGDTLGDMDLDEIRLWHANVSKEWLMMNRMHQLSGDESGLVAYYPMEVHTHNEFAQSVCSLSLNDRKSDKQISSANPLLAGQGLTAANTVPPLLEQRVAEKVAHTYTASENIIVINVTESAQRIEGCTLEFTVKNLVDKNGNYSKDIRWTAFVNRNQLRWENEEMKVVKPALKDTTLSVVIRNNSGIAESWSITDIPEWLSLSETSGVLQPLQSKELQMTISSALPIGAFEKTMFLLGNSGIYVPFYLNVKVTSDAPDWHINTGEHEFSMNLIAHAVMEDDFAEDSEDLVAAYIDGQLVGVAHPELVSAYKQYMIMMDIYCSSVEQKFIHFKYWDASTGLIYPVTDLEVCPTKGDGIECDSLEFVSGTLSGTLNCPVTMHIGKMVEQTVSVEKGWNWKSFNVLGSNKSAQSVWWGVLTKLQLIKSQTRFAEVNGEALNGSLKEIDYISCYKAKAYEDGIIIVTGVPANPYVWGISLAPKAWSWIGYLPQATLSVDAALANLYPEEGDVIKSRTGFATWDGYRWVGSLKAMSAGNGYLYLNNSAEVKVLHYPSAAATWFAPMRRQAAQPSVFTPIAAGTYPGNMTMTAKVMDGELEVTDAEVGVFCGDECRTSAVAEDGYYFLTIPGEQQVTLQLKVARAGQVYEVKEMLPYVEDSHVGSVQQPYIIQIGEQTDLETVNGGQGTMQNEKFIYRGHLYIRHAGKTFTGEGQER